MLSKTNCSDSRRNRKIKLNESPQNGTMTNGNY